MTRTLYFFSVFSMKYKWFLFSSFFLFYWRMKATNEGDIVPQVYTDWEGITNPIFLTPPLMISSILYHTLHYNKSVSALLISQLFLQSLRPRNLSFIHRVESSAHVFSPVRQSVALHQHSVIWGHLIWFPLFVLGCRSTVPAFT